MVDFLEYPHLAAIAWHLLPGTLLDDREAFSLIERSWRHVDVDALDPRERALVDRLTTEFGNGVRLV